MIFYLTPYTIIYLTSYPINLGVVEKPSLSIWYSARHMLPSLITTTCKRLSLLNFRNLLSQTFYTFNIAKFYSLHVFACLSPNLIVQHASTWDLHSSFYIFYVLTIFSYSVNSQTDMDFMHTTLAAPHERRAYMLYLSSWLCCICVFTWSCVFKCICVSTCICVFLVYLYLYFYHQMTNWVTKSWLTRLWVAAAAEEQNIWYEH